jgi:toxin ParE1/3/4
VKKPSYRLTRAADSALDDLFRRGVAAFGLRQAQDYLLALHETFEMLTRFPKTGRKFREFRRHEHGSHIIFYLEEQGAVIIVDVIRSERDVDAWKQGQK